MCMGNANMLIKILNILSCFVDIYIYLYIYIYTKTYFEATFYGYLTFIINYGFSLWTPIKTSFFFYITKWVEWELSFLDINFIF